MFTSTTASHRYGRRAALSAATALAALSFGMADAQASTVGRIFGGDLNEFGNDRVHYHGSNLQDDLKITKSGLDITFEDPNQVISPTDASCVSINAHKVTCESKEGFDEGQIETVHAYLNEGDDEAIVLASDGIGVLVDGEEGEDELMSGSARHSLLGGDDADTLIGNGGNDLIQGNSGPDKIYPGAGEDEVFAGAAADEVFAKDGQIDDIDCGSGIDAITSDAADTLSACEVKQGDVIQPPAPKDPPAPTPPATDAPASPAADGAAPATAPAQGALAPRVLKIGVQTLKITRSGKVVVRVQCPKTAVGACTVVLSGKGVAKRAVSVKPGASKTVTLKLSGKARRAAKRGKRVQFGLAVAASDAQVKAGAQTLKIARRAR